jgi:hypothetical protein
MKGLAAAVAMTVLAPFGPSWGSPADDRAWPHLLALDIPCSGDAACQHREWERFLKAEGLTDLSAPAGGRAYRWLWISGEWGFPGYVEVTVAADGRGSLRSIWSQRAKPISAANLARFETALAKTQFAAMAEQDVNSNGWVDYPTEQVMEALVDGRYHLVHRIGGIREPGIYQAGHFLEKLAH